MAHENEDHSWMNLKPSHPAWRIGIAKFITDTFEDQGGLSRVTAPCPCRACRLVSYQNKDTLEFHLNSKGFDPYYIKRHHTGGGRSAGNHTVVVADAVPEGGGGDPDDEDADIISVEHMFSSLISGAILGELKEGSVAEEPNEPTKKIFNLMEEARKCLYPGCKDATKIAFIVRLYQIKCMCGISNKGIEQILNLFIHVLPENHCLPTTFEKVREVIRELGLNYEKIHACPNDCILFRGEEYKNLNKCPKCGESRWKDGGGDGDGDGGGDGSTSAGGSKRKRPVPRKILRYFPVTPRLRRLYMNETTAKHMRWHKEELVEDGKVRHPANSRAWKHVDEMYKTFAADPRSVRLGLASDGFNPFGMLNVTYTTWPVILMPYNLPPWLCFKQSYWMMAMLIPGPKSPGINIDVYLQPLIDELKDLWDNGVTAWDAKKKENFTLRAMLLWTINDFPAYAMLSGWSTKGRFACPYCHKDTEYLWLKYGSKHCYMGHRRFLPTNHKWRRSKVSFNNQVETREAPVPLTGAQVLEQYQSFEQVTFGAATSKKRKQRDEDNRWHNWRKKSIFFELPYWQHLLIRHNLDVMHTEKNICESLIATLLQLAKNKDSEKARLDMKELGIRKDQHPVLDNKGKYSLPPALYKLGNDQKDILCNFLRGVKMPDACASNIKRCVDVNAHKVSGLKSHDYHIILQKLLPLVARHILPEQVVIPIIELSRFFSKVCSKELDETEMKELTQSIGETLCRLEMIFPPAFFDIMMHLPVHIAWEAELGGPVSYRWMYPVERYLRTLKGYVRNKACPEGSIAEGYLMEECLTFCSRFFEGVMTKLNRPDRQESTIVSEPPAGLSVFASTDYTRKKSAHKHNIEFNSVEEIRQMRHYIITNCDEATPWINEHMDELSKTNPRAAAARHKRLFVDWFETKIMKLHEEKKADDMIYSLARGPQRISTNLNRCSINGFFFRTTDAEKHLSTQNSGIVVKGEEGMEFFGVIEKIICLQFPKQQEVTLFKCAWFDVPGPSQMKSRGYNKDKFGIIDIDTGRRRYSSEPYILATQAEQVCYIKNGKNKGSTWCSVLRLKPRTLFAMPEVEDNAVVVVGDDTNVDSFITGVEHITVEEDQQEELTNWIRPGVEGLTGDASDIENAVPMDEPDHDSLPDYPDDDDTYIDDGVAAKLNGEDDDDDDFFV